jgi:hypothetical protein
MILTRCVAAGELAGLYAIRTIIDMEHLIHLLSGVLAALSHHKSSEYFTESEVPYAIAGIVSVCFAYAANTIFNKISQSRLFDWRFRTVGMWIESVKHRVGSQYAMSIITYNSKLGEFEITGDTFSSQTLEVFSSWRSMAINFPEKDSLYYLYTLKNFEEPFDDVIGIAHMSFFATPGIGRKFFDGQGYFLDKTSRTQEIHYSFERIDRKMLRDVLGKASISNLEDRRIFLREYARRKSSQPDELLNRDPRGKRHRVSPPASEVKRPDERSKS